MSYEFILSLLAAAIQSGTPILYATLGEIFTERSGVLNLGVGAGMHVLARAQVYYHRPGAWQEPPNLFNPYWGARLAPKNAAISRIGHEVDLGEVMTRLIADNVWMH